MESDSTDFGQWFRNTAPYIRLHQGKTFVLLIDDGALEAGTFPQLARDLVLLSSTGLKLVLVYGVRNTFQRELEAAGQPLPHRSNDGRGAMIIDHKALQCLVTATGSLRSFMEAQLSRRPPATTTQLPIPVQVCSGNYASARPHGIHDGVDHLYAGRLRRLACAEMEALLGEGTIVLLPPLGYSPSGQTFALDPGELAVAAATGLNASKMIVLGREPDPRMHQRRGPDLSGRKDPA